LENCLGPRLRVVGIVDPNVALAHTQRAKKLGTSHKECWEGARAFVSLEEAASHLAENGISPKLVLLGTPPSSRGNDTIGLNGELECSRLFPNSAMLVEKPLSAKAPEGVRRVMGGLEHHGGAVGVGYMLRYLKGSFVPCFV
jgi:predicted dehydrogenase